MGCKKFIKMLCWQKQNILSAVTWYLIIIESTPNRSICWQNIAFTTPIITFVITATHLPLDRSLSHPPFSIANRLQVPQYLWLSIPLLSPCRDKHCSLLGIFSIATVSNPFTFFIPHSFHVTGTFQPIPHQYLALKQSICYHATSLLAYQYDQTATRSWRHFRRTYAAMAMLPIVAGLRRVVMYGGIEGGNQVVRVGLFKI